MKLSGFLGMVALSVAALFTPPAQAAIDTELDSVCLIRYHGSEGMASRWLGSGTCFARANGYVWVLTAEHVAPNGLVTCAFTRDSYISKPIRGQVYKTNHGIDTSIVVVPESSFGGLFPKVIPLGDSSDLPAIGGRADTVGCPQGANPTGERLHVIGYVANGSDAGRIVFGPRPEFGRSGSAIFTPDGNKIIGIVSAFYTGASVNGGGTGPTCTMIRKLLWPEAHSALSSFKPDPAIINQKIELCNAPEATRLFGNRGGCDNGQCTPPTPGGSPWPEGANPGTPAIDIKPIIDNQNKQFEAQQKQIEAIISHLNQPAPTPSISPAPAGPDAVTEKLLNQQGKAIDDNAKDIKDVGKSVDTLRADVPKIVDTAIAPTKKSVDDLSENVKKNGTLAEKFAIAKEQAKENDPEAGRVKQDLEAAKLMLHDHNLGGGILGIVAGIVGIVGLVHWLRSGHGLVAAALLKASEKHPENQKLSEVAHKIATVEENWRDKLPFGHPLHPSTPLLAALGSNPLTAPAAPPVAAGALAADVASQVKAHLTALLTPAPGQPATPAPATTVNVTGAQTPGA